MPDGPPPLPSAEPALCDLCHERPLATELTKLPVCEVCREALVRRPFPGWIKLVAASVVILMIVAFVRGQGGLEAALEYERGHRNELLGQFAAAQLHFQLADKAMPGSPKVQVRLAKCALNLGDRDRAADLLMKVQGEHLDQDELRAAAEVQRQLLNSGELKEIRKR